MNAASRCVPPLLARLSLSMLTLSCVALAQGLGSGGYARPPEVISRLVEAPPPPDTSLSPRANWLVLTTREPMPGIDVVARPHEEQNYKLIGIFEVILPKQLDYDAKAGYIDSERD